MKHLKKFSTIATATGIGALLATGMTGCFSNNQQQQETKAQNAFVIIEETAPGRYKIKDEERSFLFPSPTLSPLKQLHQVVQSFLLF